MWRTVLGVAWVGWQLGVTWTRPLTRAAGIPCPRFAVMTVVQVVGYIDFYSDANNLFPSLGKESAFLPLKETTSGARPHFREHIGWRWGEKCHEVMTCRGCRVLAEGHVAVVG